MSQGTGPPALSVSPDEPLLDQPIEIRATGLDTTEAYTIHVEMEWDEATYTAEATYEADERGIVDPSSQAPTDGTYEGVHPMGLFWSMTPTDGSPSDPDSIPAQLRTTVTLRGDGEIAAKAEIIRRSRPTGVSRREIDAKGVPSDLYLPPGDGPHPGVVVLGGNDGARPDRAMPWLLAAHGYAVLAPAYFGEPGSPADALVEVPVEAVEAAVDWFGQREHVQRAPMAVIGKSRGSELAFLLGGRLERIRCVIGISPSGVAFEGLTASFRPADASAWSLAGTGHAYVPIDISLREQASAVWETLRGEPVEVVGSFVDGLEGADAETITDAELPVELIDGPVCLLAGEDDRLWDGATLARRVRDCLTDAGYEYHVECRTYGDAGHALSVPYLPTVGRESASAGRFTFALGGTPEGYAAADDDAWQAILEMLRAIGGGTGS